MFLLVPPSNERTGKKATLGAFMSTKKFWNKQNQLSKKDP
jgi:hypothetical protein